MAHGLLRGRDIGTLALASMTLCAAGFRGAHDRSSTGRAVSRKQTPHTLNYPIAGGDWPTPVP